MKTYEIRKSNKDRSVFLTTDMSPDQWNPKYIDGVLKAGGQSGLNAPPARRRVHFTPPDPHKEKIIISKVDPTPRSFPALPQFAPPTGFPRFPMFPPRFPCIPCIPDRSRRQILFHDKHSPHHSFTNFSTHDVYYEGKRYHTSEHLYQSLKFSHNPRLAEYIRTYSPSPKAVFSEAQRFFREVRPDWRQIQIKVMDTVLWHKFTQHCSLRRELLSTGDAELIEASTSDAFWGAGPDGRGRNELGKALERVRRRLQNME